MKNWCVKVRSYYFIQVHAGTKKGALKKAIKLKESPNDVIVGARELKFRR